MTIQILIGDEIRSHVLKILSGECLFERRPEYPQLFILSPWVSDVDLEFSDLYILREKEESKFYSYLFVDYNIKSINLPYALLLLKLHGGARVNIVTLPPREPNYSSDYLPRVITLLDFLDEIGCNVFVNSKLHSKLILANDLALLGSFNLSSSALYNREEIGISVNDLDNLQILESYCDSVIYESQMYGYSSLLNHGYLRRRSESEDAHILSEGQLSRRSRITRGWLLDEMIKETYHVEHGRERYGEFFYVTGGYDKFIKSYARDLNLFYITNLRRLVSSAESYMSGKDWIKMFLGYKGEESTDSVMEFVYTQFARKTIPNVKFRVKSLSTD